MSIEQFTNRQLEFTIRYISSVLDFLKSLQYKIMDEKSMNSIAKSIEKQLGVHNEKELRDFTLFNITGITSEECAAIFNKLGITNQCIMPTTNSSIIYAIKDAEYLEFCNYCEKIKKGEIDLDELLTEYHQNFSQNYIDSNSDLTHSLEISDEIINDLASLSKNLTEEDIFDTEEDELTIVNSENIEDADVDSYVDSNTDLTRELDPLTPDCDINSNEEVEQITSDLNDFEEINIIDSEDDFNSDIDLPKEEIVEQAISNSNNTENINTDNFNQDSSINYDADLAKEIDFSISNYDINSDKEAEQFASETNNVENVSINDFNQDSYVDSNTDLTRELDYNSNVDFSQKTEQLISDSSNVNSYNQDFFSNSNMVLTRETDYNSNVDFSQKTEQFVFDLNNVENINTDNSNTDLTKELDFSNSDTNSSNFAFAETEKYDPQNKNEENFDDFYRVNSNLNINLTTASETNIDYSSDNFYNENNQLHKKSNSSDFFKKDAVCNFEKDNIAKSENKSFSGNTDSNKIDEKYIPEYSEKIDTFQKNYQEEITQQQNIRDTQIRQRHIHENATVECIGKGYDIPALAKYPDTASKKNYEKLSARYELANNNSNQEKTDILLNQINLRHGSNQALNRKVIDLTGGAVIAPVSIGKENTKYAEGKKEFSNFSNTFMKSAVLKSQKNSMLLNMEKYQTKLETRQLKTLDSFLQNKGQKRLNFVDKNAYKESMDSIYTALEKCGLATSKRLDKNNISYDVSKFDLLYKQYKKGNKTDLIKALGFTATASEVDIRRVIEDLRNFTFANRHNNYAVSKGIKTTKNNYQKWRKKLVQKNATYEGYEDVSQTITTIRTSYTLFKTSFSTIASSYKKMYKRTGQWIGRRSKIVKNHVAKKVEKWDKKAERKKQKQINKNIRKKERIIRRNERLRSARNTTIQKVIGANNYNRLSLANRAFKSAKRKAQRRISNTFLAKIKRKLLSVINPIMNAFNALKLWLIKAIGMAFIIYMILGGGLMLGGTVIVTILDFFDTDDEFDVDEVFASDAGRLVLDLIYMEGEWARQLTDEEEFAKVALDEVFYTDEYLEIEEYAEKANLEYDATEKAIKGPSPFGEIELKETDYKWIKNVDGGIEISYKNASGGTDRTSNIKEIISLGCIYFENETDYDSVDENDEFSYLDIFIGPLKKAAVIIASKFESTVLSHYAIDLFNISHRETYELEPVILPTKWAKEAAEQQIGISVDGNEIKYCPSLEYDGYGCEEYNNFGYDENGEIFIRDKYDEPQLVKAWVYPKEEDTCVCNSLEEFETAFINFPECFSISISENGTTDSESVLVSNAPSLASKLASLNGDISEVGEFEKGEDSSYTVLAYSEVKEKQPEPGYTDVSKYRTVYNVTITRLCSECHTGYYCGGHLKTDIIGIIYGFLDEWTNEDATYELVGKVEEGAYEHQQTLTVKIKEENLENLNDIFDCDHALIHPSERSDWEGWTADNMEQAIIKYQQDWEDLYEITINSALGNNSISNVEVTTIMDEILKNYPDLSEERQEAIKRALSYVGNIGYSQKHHACPLDGPCRSNPAETCKLSDCSGFVSNIWYDRIGTIHSTYSFKSTYGSVMTGFSTSTAVPGDILLHYGEANHALLYIGEFEYNGVKNTWSIDCSTVKGVGNVFLRHRSYYGECKVINADKL